MKIGILTQPLLNNYGGLLQAYALQTALKNMGHEVWIIKRISGKPSLIQRIKSNVKQIVQICILRRKNITSPCGKKIIPTSEENRIISLFTSQFIDKNIKPITESIDNSKKLKEVTKNEFNAFVVGSDQVWRLNYSPNILNFFLDFAFHYKNIIRIAYAASFGVDKWHYSKRLTKKCKQLASRFDAISVREISGVHLCKQYLNVDAQHLVDPTMLLTKLEYLQLIETENEDKTCNKLFYYLLDETERKKNVLNTISKKLGLCPCTVMPSKRFSLENRDDINSCIYPPVTKWLKGFINAKFVITDSFHGCIFSILFNIPFIAFGNEKRGLARFESLLSMFDITDRLLFTEEALDLKILLKPIDWAKVNRKLLEEKSKGLMFLKNNLENTDSNA